MLRSFDLVLYDSSGKYVREMPIDIENWCEENAVCFRMSDAAPRHTNISIERIQEKLPTESKISAPQFKSLNASLRGKYWTFYRPPVVQQLCIFLKNITKLDGVYEANGLVKNDRLDRKKVLIHPTSSSEKKNWTSKNFVHVFLQLKADGLKPYITVSPPERQYWIDFLSSELKATDDEIVNSVPLFRTIKDLAEFYMDARIFIGNDSGNGHLASALGVPTIQIFSGWKKYPAWRAGWGKNTVITPRFPFNLIKKRWKSGVSVDRVMAITRIKLVESANKK